MKYLLKILMNILWSCLQAGTFGIESVIREREVAEFAVFKCETTSNSVTGHVCVNTNLVRKCKK